MAEGAVAATGGAALPVAVLASSLIASLAIFVLPEHRVRLRTLVNVAAAIVKLVLVLVMLWTVFQGQTYEARIAFVPGADLVLRSDPFSLLFVTLSAVLWLATTIYAVGYLEGAPDRRRFFGFFSLCVASTMGIAFAGNLVTFFVFYELLTLSTYPLVVHRGGPESIRAGSIYLGYTLLGGVVLLAGIAWIHALVGPIEFVEGGALRGAATAPGSLSVIFFLLVVGLGVKAALVPLHGWLPIAMVAPAPVSALLHAVAVVKAGAFGITRVVYDVFGIRVANELGVLRPLAVVASVTIFYGSFKALAQDDLKRRLAYSTVSQLSYIVLGVATFGPIATIGGIVHLVHQGLMKIVMFFCAGNLAEELDVHRVSELDGVGRRMPLTMAAFTISALGMIGLPPVAGFITKWYLGAGALDAGQPWVLAVLLISSLLNAAYFLPIVYAAWFRAPRRAWPPRTGLFEVRPSLLGPTVAVAVIAMAVALFAQASMSPLGWVHIIAAREYAGELLGEPGPSLLEVGR
jgi:multicomponent Na+:H+ antiporter subunit D